jgi:hypothetical protein
MTLHVLDNGSSKQPVSCHVLDAGVKKAVSSAFRLVNGTKEQVYSSVLPDYSSITINDLTITKYVSNPILEMGAAEEYDEVGIRNQVLYYEDGTYYLYYWVTTDGWLADVNAPLAWATASNLKGPWTKQGQFMVTGAAHYTSGGIVKHNGTYYQFLVYAPNGNDQSTLGTSLITASSPSGPWTLYNSGTPIISLATNFCPNSVIPAPVSSGYTWMMFGCIVGATNPIKACYSNDLISWTTPITLVSSTPISGWSIENPYVFKVGATWFFALFGYNYIPAISGTANSNGILMWRANDDTLTSWTYLGVVILNSGNGTDWDWAHIDFPSPYTTGNHGVSIIYNGGQAVGAAPSYFGKYQEFGVVDIVFP